MWQSVLIQLQDVLYTVWCTLGPRGFLTCEGELVCKVKTKARELLQNSKTLSENTSGTQGWCGGGGGGVCMCMYVSVCAVSGCACVGMCGVLVCLCDVCTHVCATSCG